MIRAILLAVALILAAGPAIAADGSAQKDPIFKNNNGPAKDNLIVRDKDGGVTGYLVSDPLFPGENWIYFPRQDPNPAPATSYPATPATATDSVGE